MSYIEVAETFIKRNKNQTIIKSRFLFYFEPKTMSQNFILMRCRRNLVFGSRKKEKNIENIKLKKNNLKYKILLVIL